ncbi:MAG: LegC family aminotransferase [Cellvibrionaceae bacterium]
MNNQTVIDFIQSFYQTKEFIPLHAPVFCGDEKKYVLDAIDSTYVSSVGQYVDDFEKSIELYTGCAKAVAVVNGTAALHIALYMAGVERGDLVITQALTFVATCNALYHMGAMPVFLDISPLSLGLCPKITQAWLDENAQLNDKGECIYAATGQKIKAIVPMHTFGHPVDLEGFQIVCKQWNITLVEDAAESLGSLYKNVHTGTIARFSALSFNGNKTITTGGGGAILFSDKKDAERAKHITTTAKVPHLYEFYHDEAGFNYRMPNLNAALGCAQMKNLNRFIRCKRYLASCYANFFKGSQYEFFQEPDYAVSNYWLNAVVCENEKVRDKLLQETNDKGVMTRPVWQLMHRLPMFSKAIKGDLSISESLEKRLVNLPSTPVGVADA